jgi:hypothetical protein
LKNKQAYLRKQWIAGKNCKNKLGRGFEKFRVSGRRIVPATSNPTAASRVIYTIIGL